jgi:hypothetical protein
MTLTELTREQNLCPEFEKFFNHHFIFSISVSLFPPVIGRGAGESGIL